ncbi:malate dehydrogenase [uncultured Methanobrevibacter sp.]|uniref:malate dehydrogenase n=1 Tax=uncultured Methanobrevibacter sp. TaxID=253161 RepID=UPI0025DE8E31|nr:malate dehydrogenase [uncultured Methanobrevibacter sp.]
MKVTIFGATGTIGKTVTFKLASTDIVDEIVLFTRKTSIDKATGEVFDMYDALAAEDIDCKLIPSYDYNDIRNSDIVLISAGTHRSKGMNRLELAIPNAKIVQEYAKQTAIYAPNAIILVTTNPVDVMTNIALEASGFNRRKVIGLGNHLDSLRLKTYLSKHLNINSREVHTRVVGEHGDHMVPLLSSTTIGGLPLNYFAEPTSLDVPDIVNRLKTAGNTIIGKKGATEYGPAYAISNLIKTILTDSHKILTVSIYLQGEILGVSDVCLGVPVILYRHGILFIVPITMNDDEKEEFLKASKSIKDVTEKVRQYLKDNP